MKTASLMLGSLVMLTTAHGAELHYAESAAMTAHAADGATTFDVRIARFTEQGRGTLWFYVYIDGRHYSLVDNSVQLVEEGPTPVQHSDVTFAVTGRSAAALAGAARYRSAMRGTLTARGTLHATAHPQAGSGVIPVEIAASFTADHTPINVRPGRIEVMGRVQGTLSVDGVCHVINLPGKWHEQTGVRPSFAPAFTYMFVQGQQSGLMTTRHAGGAWGYVFRDGQTQAVTAMDIDPYGLQQRRFTATLENGERVKGRAQVLREVSVPIEGKRRPGATVIVESELGRMVGVLNDWQP